MELPTFVPFVDDNSLSLSDRGHAALLYIILHDHTAGIDPLVLRYAQAEAIRMIAPRDTISPLLTRCNRAIDLIVQASQYHAHQSQSLAVATRAAADPDVTGGSKVPLVPPAPVLPPAPVAVPVRQKVEIIF